MTPPSTRSSPAGRNRPSTRSRRPMDLRGVLRLLLRTGCWVAIFVGLGLGLYLTLRPSGDFSTIWWIPRNIERWADYYGRIRNIPAFAMLAVPFMIIANGRRARRKAIYWLAAFCAVTEAAQYFIPARWCEWQDVACGWAGLAITWALFELAFWGAWRVRQYLKKRKTTGLIPPIAKPGISSRGSS